MNFSNSKTNITTCSNNFENVKFTRLCSNSIYIFLHSDTKPVVINYDFFDSSVRVTHTAIRRPADLIIFEWLRSRNHLRSTLVPLNQLQRIRLLKCRLQINWGTGKEELGCQLISSFWDGLNKNWTCTLF